MKTYKVTVNGNTYDVGVEEVSGAVEVKTVQAAAPAPKAAPAPTPKAEPAPAPKAAPAAKQKAPAPVAGAKDVIAPMPGTVLSVNVAEGDKIKAGQLLLIFEAMKMENELIAEHDGTVKKVYVAKGDALEAGIPVISIA